MFIDALMIIKNHQQTKFASGLMIKTINCLTISEFTISHCPLKKSYNPTYKIFIENNCKTETSTNII